VSMTTEKTRLVILFEHEVRAAARALAEAMRLVAVAQEDETAGDAAGQALYEAAGLCRVALHGAEDEAAILALVKAEAFGRG
jgi:hypothetical protein